MLNRISFVKKIIILFIGSVLIPLGIQNYVYYTQTERNIQKDMMDKLNDSLNDKTARIERALSGVTSLARTYAYNETLCRYLDNSYRNELSYLTVYQNEIKKLFEKDLAYYQQIREVMVYTDNATIFNGAYIRTLQSFDEDSMYENLIDLNEKEIGNSSDNMTFRVAYEQKRITSSEGRSLSIICLMNHFRQYFRSEKLLRIDINTTYFNTILSEGKLFDNVILADSEGRVISSVHSYRQNGEYEVFYPEETEKGIVVLSRKLQGFPVMIYGLYNSKIISNEFEKSRIQTVLITIVSLLLAILCIWVVVGDFSKRLYILVNQAKEIAKGNFIKVEHDDEGIDEISILEEGMNQMSIKLHELIEKDYRTELTNARLEQEAVQAKLLALQSQINPHFLFNALESIRLKAMVKGEAETARMIRHMSKMFRSVINWDQNIIYLEDEINFLDEFLNIQNYRFEDEFEYHINVEKEALKCLIPKMIVQTLVENACIHGVEAISNNRIVSFTAYVKEEKLVLIVEDNGGGMQLERLEALKMMFRGEEKVSGSVGIYNVFRRLQLYYGEEFIFEIDSVLGKGTKCIIQIPVKY